MKICLVSNEILGATKNGGIATATSHLGVLLARQGHHLTLLYTGRPPIEPQNSWSRLYRAARMEVVHLRTDDIPVSPFLMRSSTGIFEHLRSTGFDVILFQDWLALGHACTVAKTCGLAFSKTALAIIAHSNTPWLLEANQSFPDNVEQLQIAHMEQQAVEHSDALVSPSEYMLCWMRRAGWKLPETSTVIPYYLNALESPGAPSDSRPTSRLAQRIPHLVFFGRLEERKGINLFLKALASERLGSHRFRVTFLGKPGTRSVPDIRAIVSQTRPDLLPDLEFQADLASDEAQLFLSQNGCIPVMPSLVDNSPCVIYESLRLGLPFIASASGGSEELIHPDDRGRCLFAPTADALAGKLAEVLTSESWEAPRPNYDQSQVAQAWLAWFSQVAGQGPRARVRSVTRTSEPEVSLAITHYERPKLLEQCLRALSRQSDPDFDLIVVDDGSQSEASQVFLHRLEHGYPGLRLTLVRQENKYLGAARNEALRSLATPYVIFMDDDNIAFPNMVEVFRAAAHASDADIVSCQMQFFRDPWNEPNRRLHREERWAYSGGPAALGLLQNVFGDAVSIIRRAVFEEVGLFHEQYGVTHEDWDFLLRAVLDGRSLLSIPEPLFWYRLSPNSMLRTTSDYQNMRVIARSIHSRLPASLAPLADLAIGCLRVASNGDVKTHPNSGPDHGAANGINRRLSALEREVAAIYQSRTWRGLTRLGGLIQRLQGMQRQHRNGSNPQR